MHHGVGLGLGTVVGWTQFNTGFMRLTAKSECLFRTGLNFEQKYVSLCLAARKKEGCPTGQPSLKNLLGAAYKSHFTPKLARNP
jgi:hypothetical protein